MTKISFSSIHSSIIHLFYATSRQRVYSEEKHELIEGRQMLNNKFKCINPPEHGVTCDHSSIKWQITVDRTLFRLLFHADRGYDCMTSAQSSNRQTVKRVRETPHTACIRTLQVGHVV